ncbi:MAG: S8 family serine peptidase, partial [Kineosporiaceae bacterium]
GPSPRPGGPAEQRVVVMATAGNSAAVQRRATRLGIQVTRRLGVIDGFAASGTSEALARLAATPGVVSVSPDRAMSPMSIVPTLGYDPADTGSLSSTTQIVGAQAAWAKGYTGAGIDVAVIDTGVAPVPGLNAAGKVITGPDLSFDAPGAATPGLDGFGHGTFMASLIAGRDASVTTSAAGCTTCLNSSGYSDTTAFVGVAPDARIVNVKVGAADGATDVSQVIAAIDWVTQHAHDPGLNIRVLNLSFGTDSTQSYQLDPLAQAAEQAWKHGIVVVAAAGNEGLRAGSLASPAYDPYLLAVGGDDTMGTLPTKDDRVPDFAQHGTLARPVDVIAPATHLLGLRVPGSFIDTLAANTGQVGARFQRGSGTSEAAAIVSGLAALLVQQHPEATPDQIKALIRDGATELSPITDTTKLDAIASSLKLTAAQYATVVDTINISYSGQGIATVGTALEAPLPVTKQTAAASTGTGTLEASRGGTHVVNNGVTLTGEKDIFGRAFSSKAMAAAQVSGTAWTGGKWNGSRWSGDGWSGSRWSSTTWAGTDWAGSRWSGSRWSGMAWDGSRWSGTGWSGSRWSGQEWAGSRWSSSTWS